MATLDDKLLGEKLHNYCSSSSSEEEDNNDDDDRRTRKSRGLKFIPESKLTDQTERNMRRGAGAENTGPKGVIKDWQRFKQLENEKNTESQEERLRIAKRLAMTCRSDDLDKEISKEQCSSKQEQTSVDNIEKELLDDEFFQEYLKKRLDEMQKKVVSLPRFGKVVELTTETYLNEIDNENPNVTIIIHIYDQKITECKTMNNCLDDIASQYPIVKCCKVRSSEINLTDKFRKLGCPALLIYKNKELIGNFVKMADEFGDEFVTSDVENFLIEQGFLPSEDIISKIRGTENQESDE